MALSTSPEFSGIKITIGTKSIGHLDSVGSIIDKSRGVQKYVPINDKEYDEIVALGTLTQGPFSGTTLYDPEGAEGINDLEAAIDLNTIVELTIELNNSLGTNGTKIVQSVKVSSFKVDGDKDGFFKCSFQTERLGKATVTAAA